MKSTETETLLKTPKIGAAELGKLMREQRDSRMGIYPDGNPNSGQP